MVVLIIGWITTVSACDYMEPKINYIDGLSPTEDTNRLFVRLSAGSGRIGGNKDVILDLTTKQLGASTKDDLESQITEPVKLENEYSISVGFDELQFLWMINEGNLVIMNESIAFPEMDGFILTNDAYLSFVSKKFNHSYMLFWMNNPSTYKSISVATIYDLNNQSVLNQYTSPNHGYPLNDKIAVFDDEQVIRVHGRTSCNDVYYYYFNETAIELLTGVFLATLTFQVFDPRINQIITVGTSDRHYVSIVEYPSFVRTNWNISQGEIDRFFKNRIELNFYEFPILVSMLGLVALRKKKK